MADIPWTYSKALQRHYIYLPNRDELLFQDGQRMPRPDALSIESLEGATYDGSTSQLSQSPPTANARYTTASRPIPTSQRDARREAQHDVPRSYSTSDARDDLTTRMARARLNSSFPDGVLSPNPDNRQELVARVVVDRAQGAGQTNATAITKADVYGMPTESLYPEYTMRKKSFFFVGKIFSILWSEPAGTTTAAPTVMTSRTEAVIQGPYGEMIFSKIRRFVVFRTGEGYCNALPISTYSGKGVGKKGVVKSEHAIIYTNPLPAMLAGEKPTRGEEPMRPIPIRVDPDTRAEKLDPASRVNFGHPHTIQYNVKVKSCGKLPPESVSAMIEQFKLVFLPTSQSKSSSTRAESSRAGAAAETTIPRSMAGTSRNADDTVQAALLKLMETMSRNEAIQKMLDVLMAKGLEQDEATTMIRKSLN